MEKYLCLSSEVDTNSCSRFTLHGCMGCRFALECFGSDDYRAIRHYLKHKTPEIVCLCGSTRFWDTFQSEGWRLTLEGKIVLSIGVCKHAEDHGGEALGQDCADMLDELHFRKIDISNRVHILNVGGYIGDSTRRELMYAEQTKKKVTFLEPG